MTKQRQCVDCHFGPRLHKPSTKKYKSKIMKKSLEQLKKTQEYYRLPVPNRNNNANERGNDDVKDCPRSSKTYDSSKTFNAKDQQNKVAAQKMQQTPDERANARIAPWPTGLKQPSSRPFSSRLNNDAVCLRKNAEKFKPSSSKNNGVVSPEKNNEKSRPSSSQKNTEKSRLSSGILEKPAFVGSKDDSNSTLGILKKSHASSVVRDSSITKRVVSGEVHEDDLLTTKEALNSSLVLKGNQVIQDLRRNSANNSFPIFGKDLLSYQLVEASCMGNNMERNGELLEEKPKTHEDVDSEKLEKCRPKKKRRRYIAKEDEEGDGGDHSFPIFGKDLSGYQSAEASCMGNNMERNLESSEEKLETHEDDDSEELENCRPKKKQRRYIANEDEEDDGGDQNLVGVGCCTVGMTTQTAVVKDGRTEVSKPFVSESVMLQHYSFLPIDEPIWSGFLKIGSKEYVSSVAHLSAKYCEKVWKLSRSLQPVVEVTKVPRLEAWPKRFEASKPTDDDIALYFLPHEMRPEEALEQLVKEVMENDMVLRAVVGEAEMLIFPSIVLPEQHQTFQKKPYLWGLFKRREDKVPIVEEQQHGTGRCAQEEEMGLHVSHGCVGKEGYRVAGSNMDVGLEAPEEAERQDMEHELTPSLARPDASRIAEGVARPTSAPTMAAAMPENHGQIHASLGVPSGALFGFIVRQTPRLEKLIQEMEREGAVVVAMWGEMIASGLGQSIATG